MGRKTKSTAVDMEKDEASIRISFNEEPRNDAKIKVIGIGGGVVISRLLAPALTELNPLDPIAFGGCAFCLALIALLACYIPARRAAKVDPITSLRFE